MSLLEACVRSPLAAALGWTLLHSLWQGAAAAAALGAALLVLRSARARYAASLLTLLLIAAAFLSTLLLQRPTYIESHAADVSPVLLHRAAPFASGFSAPLAPALAALAPWLAPFWAAGVCLVTLFHLAGSLSARRLRRRGVCAPPPLWQDEIARLAARLSLSRPVLLLESGLAGAPIVLGHFRPLILMPVGLLTGLPAAQIEAILLHELAHIRRYDYLVNVFQRGIEALLFYHPVVWWVSHLIRAERENCCDDAALAAGASAHTYATALTALEQFRFSGSQPAVAATGGNLMKRIQRLLNPRPHNGAWSPGLAAVLLAATAAVTLTAWQSDPPAQATTAPPTASRADVSPYFRWLNQDVVYIIDDRERAAFEKLTTDEERDKFIEQFWLRRDPTPGTPVNEFKQEHYRRIAYANQRFATSAGQPGWRTDRGRYYIVYGPPDELESHPNGGDPIADPFEAWLWRHIPGVGDNVILTFVDHTHTGDFRVVPAPAR